MVRFYYRSTNHTPTTPVVVECLFKGTGACMGSWHMDVPLFKKKMQHGFLGCNDTSRVHGAGEDFWSDNEGGPAED